MVRKIWFGQNIQISAYRLGLGLRLSAPCACVCLCVWYNLFPLIKGGKKVKTYLLTNIIDDNYNLFQFKVHKFFYTLIVKKFRFWFGWLSVNNCEDLYYLLNICIGKTNLNNLIKNMLNMIGYCVVLSEWLNVVLHV